MRAGVPADVCPPRPRRWLPGFILAVGWFLMLAPVQAGLLDLVWDPHHQRGHAPTPLTDLDHYRSTSGPVAPTARAALPTTGHQRGQGCPDHDRHGTRRRDHLRGPGDRRGHERQ
jgi:hypothetical protein